MIVIKYMTKVNRLRKRNMKSFREKQKKDPQAAAASRSKYI